MANLRRPGRHWLLESHHWEQLHPFPHLSAGQSSAQTRLNPIRRVVCRSTYFHVGSLSQEAVSYLSLFACDAAVQWVEKANSPIITLNLGSNGSLRYGNSRELNVRALNSGVSL